MSVYGKKWKQHPEKPYQIMTVDGEFVVSTAKSAPVYEVACILAEHIVWLHNEANFAVGVEPEKTT